jgi:hypothetical protein
MAEYASLSKTPHALADGLMLVFQYPAKRLSSGPGSFQGVKKSDTRCGCDSGSSASGAGLLNDIGWLVFGRMAFIGMTLAVHEGDLIRGALSASARCLFDGHSG